MIVHREQRKSLMSITIASQRFSTIYKQVKYIFLDVPIKHLQSKTVAFHTDSNLIDFRKPAKYVRAYKTDIDKQTLDV